MESSVDGTLRHQRALAICLIAFAMVAFSANPTPVAAVDPDEYSIAKIFYGSGWIADPTSGLRRYVALLNLTEGYQKHYPNNGTLDAFSQIFIEFSIPADASGPEDGAALRIHFSYYVSMSCIHLDTLTCPLGSNDTAVVHDTFDLEVRRIIEYRDADGSGGYEPGDPIVNAISLAQPESPHVRAWPFAFDGSMMDLPYDWSTMTDETQLSEGALFAGDPLLDQLSHFWISTGDGVPTNLTLNSFFFLRPTMYQAVPLTPTTLKLDLSLEHMSFVASDTAAALEFKLTSSQFRFSANESGSSDGVFTNASAAQAFFTWSPNATADGVSSAVRSTVIASNESATVYLSYPRATAIYHDPVVGLAYVGQRFSAAPPRPPSTPGRSGTPVWIPILAGTAVIIGVGAYLVVRHSRRPPRA